MGKLLILALLASLATKWLSGRWPWQLMQESERSQKEAIARAVGG